MKRILLFILGLSPLLVEAQDNIFLRNGVPLDCKITRIDSSIIYYDFYKGDRKISSFVDKKDVRSYQINTEHSLDKELYTEDSIASGHNNTVFVDTTKYIKETNKWINLITYSQHFGLHAKGWSAKYYGYNLKNTSNWAIPIVFSIEMFYIYAASLSDFNYNSVSMSYFMFGISPFYKLNDYIFLNLSGQFLFGSETLGSYYEDEKTNSIFGFLPSQGIYFVPKSKVGITVGLGIYEKFLTSEVYKNDIGLRLEVGIKF